MRLRSLICAGAVSLAKKVRRPLYIVGAVTFSYTMLHASQEGALKVMVLKPDKTPLVGATIRANVAVSSPSQINSALTTKTDQNGIATFWKLTPGIFTIQVEVDGYEAGAIRTDVQADKVSHIKVLLRPLPAVEVGIEDTFDALDPTSATTGLNVKPDMILTIPTRDRISDMALLVPGVALAPTPARANSNSLSSVGDPALLVTLNRDRLGFNEFSMNNYLLDGIDVSNALSGRGTVNVMKDLIADCDIKTGGVSAEYQAKSGIFYNVTTINGGNEFHGGLSFDYTPNSLRAGSKAGRPSIQENAQSVGFWVSGPLIQSKLWFVAAAQKILDHGQIALGEGASATPGETRPFTANKEENLFAKLTWQIDPANRLIGEFHSNRGTGDNGDNPSTVTNWLQKTDIGGDRYLLWYSFQKPWMIADFKVGHDFQRSNRNDLGTGNSSLNLFSVNPLTPVQSQFGTYGISNDQHMDRNDYRADFLIPLTTGPVSHTLKLGYEEAITKFQANYAYSVPMNQDIDQAMTFDDVVNNGLTYLQYFASTLVGSINNNPAYANIKNQLLAPGATSVTFADLANYQFNEADPNLPGAFYVLRESSAVARNPSSIRTEMKGYYVQDYMTWGRVTFSPGFRVDSYTATDDLGQSSFHQRNLFAPRVGLSWDVRGDAKDRAYAYFGRYYNPAFGSSIVHTGSNKSTGIEIDARLFGQWVNAYEVGTTGVPDVVFGDNLRMPYTDEIRVGFDHLFKLGNTVNTFSIAGIYRKDKDIIGALDPYTYSDASVLEDIARGYFHITNTGSSMSAQEAKVINAVRGLAMPLSTFSGGGHDGQFNNDNYIQVFKNIPGAERTYKSVDVSYRAENPKTQFLVAFSWLDAEGTSLEVGEMTGAGTNPMLDARLPWMHGHQDGSLNWLAKTYGSYKFDNGFILGLYGEMDSGYHYTPAYAVGGVSLQPNVPADVNELDGFKLGQKMTPKRVRFDLHAEKRFQVNPTTQLWLSANVFNLFNNQNGVALSEGTNVHAGVQIDQPYRFQAPRTVALSAKFRF